MNHIIFNASVNRLQAWLYSKNEVHNMIANMLKFLLSDSLGPIPDDIIESLDEHELRDWYSDALDILLNARLSSWWDLSDTFDEHIVAAAFKLLLRHDEYTSSSFGTLAMGPADYDHDDHDHGGYWQGDEEYDG